MSLSQVPSIKNEEITIKKEEFAIKEEEETTNIQNKTGRNPFLYSIQNFPFIPLELQSFFYNLLCLFEFKPKVPNFSSKTISAMTKISKENIKNLNIFTNLLNLNELETWQTEEKVYFSYKNGKDYEKNLKIMQLFASKHEKQIESFEKINFTFQFLNHPEVFEEYFDFSEENLKNHDKVFFNYLDLNSQLKRKNEENQQNNEIFKRINKKKKVINFLKKKKMKRIMQKKNQKEIISIDIKKNI